MGEIGAVAFDRMMQSRGGRWAFLAAVFVSAYLGIIMVKEDAALRQQALERREVALQLWMKECGKPVDECAVAWDASFTLREVYRDRVLP